MRYAVHGLIVDSDVPLHANSAPDYAGADVVMRVIDRTRTRDEGDHDLLSWQFDNGSWVSASRCADGTVLVEFSNIMRCSISPAIDEVSIEIIVPAMAGILVEGWLLAFLLELRGEIVLHASAVSLPHAGAVAFVGNSGMGKSTLATALCAAGARFITDDVARVFIDDRGPSISAGSTAARLRQAAVELVGDVEGATTAETADARLSVALPNHVVDDAPLMAVLVPWPMRSATAMELDWLAPSVALVEIMQYPRVFEWVDPPSRARQFDLAGRLIDHVPVAHLTVPWNPRSGKMLLRELLRVLEERPAAR